ncbi:hypothetical protein [Legionella shakespearei]|uniref:Substrate of the Dot/Icm secretion system n=1 Tax=Legionella shakespearei DSM 23087 TaxID=1122169 RepID=A0A0W0YLT6_9GAMM|nr:hypothetical protein [Legionella shakespearei]KTD57845.1 substrate of the Dot/Icm secretion system [Legionella shakespearei DSM 23087]
MIRVKKTKGSRSSNATAAERNNNFYEPVYHRLYGQCLESRFRPMVSIMSSDNNQLSVTFPIHHQIHKAHLLDFFNAQPPHLFSQDNDSRMTFVFTKADGKYFIKFNSNTYTDLADYNLTPLLETFVGPNRPRYSYEREKHYQPLRINRHEGFLSTQDLKVPFSNVENLDDLDFDDTYTGECLRALRIFKNKCISPFIKATMNSSTLGQDLGQMIHLIDKNYKSISDEQYHGILAKLDEFEQSSFYKDNPALQFHFTIAIHSYSNPPADEVLLYDLAKVRESITFLRQQALKSGRGSEVTVGQIHNMLSILYRHEGAKPTDGQWFPDGSIAILSEQLGYFFPTLNQAQSSINFSQAN